MCGIVGSYYYKQQNPDEGYLHWCLKTMAHRGPDSSGTWSNEKNYLAGFVRLSIRDLSAHGSQPMLSDCGRYCISFNGEIYNTDKLSKLLLPYRSSYKSTTDTEILLYALMHLGIRQTLETANGIFAFAFYDIERNLLTLARDRMGIKPLYIGYSNEGLLYSSQYDHIINHSFCSNNSLQADAVELYTCLGYVPEGLGLIAGTQLIPHGHYITVQPSGWQLTAYYNYPAMNTPGNESINEVVARSVNQQLVSDVPLGTFMSGGVDSTLVTHFAAKQQPVQSFTIGLHNSPLDESDEAAAFAASFNTTHETRVVEEKDLLDSIAINTKAYSEPFADFSSIPTLLLSKLAAGKVKVALSGDGGDELFWGYPRNAKALHHAAVIHNNQAAKYYRFIRQRLLNQAKTVGVRHLKANNIVDYYYQSLFIAGASSSAQKILHSFKQPAPFFLKKAQEVSISFKDDVQVMNLVRKMEMDLHLQRILLKVDRAGMYHSLEIRVPLLDNLVLDYSTSVNYKDCIINNTGKANLKKVLAQATSDHQVYRPKKGFDIPMKDWLNSILYKDVEEKLMYMPLLLSVYFKRDQLAQLLKQHKEGRADHSWTLWAVYTLVLWHQQHYKSFNAREVSNIEKHIPGTRL